jgi:IMP dehydrogenase
MMRYKDFSPCFDDILLVPRESFVRSRHDVDLTMSIGYGERSVNLSLPVIASPMDTVCDLEMCIAMDKSGGMGVLHRFMPEDLLIKKTKTLSDLGCNFGVSIGATNGYMNLAQDLCSAGAKIILVDTANGHSSYAVQAVSNLRNMFGESIHIMAGNVSTYQGFAALAEAGADSVRVGIGGGSACTTRLVSGHGMPTLSSIMEINEESFVSDYDCSIIADGGIRNSGDMVKSFAAGASAVMLGSMLAGTDESPGDIVSDTNGHEYKMFRGMASAQAQSDAQGKVSVAEGIATTVPYKGSVEHVLQTIRGGLGSGCSYSGVSVLSALSEAAEYVEVSYASIFESKPHAL